MKENKEGTKSDTGALSVSELRKNKSYIRKDVRVTNPRSFLRNLKNSINALGYELNKELELKIERYAVGEIDYIDTPIVGTKTYTHKKHRNRLLLIGIALSLVGILILLLNTMMGFILFGCGELIVIMGLQTRVENVNKIWLLLEGEARAAWDWKSNFEKMVEEEQVVPQLTVHIAGESSSDREGLQKEVKQLSDRLDSLAQVNATHAASSTTARAAPSAATQVTPSPTKRIAPHFQGLQRVSKTQTRSPTLIRSRVALDVNDVMANTAKEMIRVWNKKTGKNYRLEDVTWLDFEPKNRELVRMAPKEVYDLCLYVWSKEWDSIEPLADASLLEEFTKHFDVDLVTTTNAKKGIENWLRKHYPGLKFRLVIVEPHDNKAVLDYDIYIDDAPHLADFIKKYPDKTLYLVRQNWNSRVDTNTGNIISVGSVNEAFRQLIKKGSKSK